MSKDIKKTILYDEHIKLGAKMGEFGGWDMPLWYKSGQIKEHLATRKNCGIFDICHMGEFIVTGKDSLKFWQKICTNAVDKIVDGQAQYQFMLNENGGTIDDCILYRFNEERWMLVVNAGTIEKDFKWLEKNLFGDVKLTNISDETGKIDLQGITAPKTLAKIVGKEKLSDFKFFRFQENFDIAGINVILSRTGYTGEIGFEIYCKTEDTLKLWNLLLKEGEEFGILPCGLGARDSLRVEAGLPLYGHELDDETVSIGHKWDFAIKNEGNFIGKKALEKAKESGKHSYIIPFHLEGKRKALPEWKVKFDDEVVGEVITGIMAPYLDNAPIGFAKVKEYFRLDSTLNFVDPEGKVNLVGKVVDIPFLELTSRRKIIDFL